MEVCLGGEEEEKRGRGVSVAEQRRGGIIVPHA